MGPRSATTELQLQKKRKRTQSSNTDPNKKVKRVEFQSFKSRLADISVKNASYEVESSSQSALDGCSVSLTLRKLRSVNLTEDFADFFSEVSPLCDSLPILLHNLSSFVELCLKHLSKQPSNASLAIMETIAALAKDTREALLQDTPSLLEGVIDLLLNSLEDTAVIEGAFQCLCHLLRFLGKYLEFSSCVALLGPLLVNRKPFLRQFACEALSVIVLRRVVGSGRISEVISELLKNLDELDFGENLEISTDLAASLIFETIRSKLEGSFHSAAVPVVEALMLLMRTNFQVGTVLQGLFEKARIAAGTTAVLETFGDCLVGSLEEISRSEEVSTQFCLLISQSVLPSHRPNKEDDFSVLDSFVNELLSQVGLQVLERSEISVRVELIVRLWAVAELTVIDRYFTENCLVQNELNFLNLLLTSLGADSVSRIPGIDSALQFMLKHIDQSDAAVALARCANLIGPLSMEIASQILGLATVSDKPLPYWEILGQISRSEQIQSGALCYLSDVQPSDPVVVAKVLGCVGGQKIPCALVDWVLTNFGGCALVLEALADLMSEQSKESCLIASEISYQLLIRGCADRAVREQLLRLAKSEDSLLEICLDLERQSVDLQGERLRRALIGKLAKQALKSQGRVVEISISIILDQFTVPISTVWPTTLDALVEISSGHGEIVWKFLQDRLTVDNQIESIPDEEDESESEDEFRKDKVTISDTDSESDVEEDVKEVVIETPEDVTMSLCNKKSDLLEEYLKERAESLKVERSTEKNSIYRNLWILAGKLLTDQSRLRWAVERVLEIVTFQKFLASAALSALSEACSSMADSLNFPAAISLEISCFDVLIGSWDSQLASAGLAYLAHSPRFSETLLPALPQLHALCGAGSGPAFRAALMKFPLDSADPGVLKVVFKILFGKLSRKVKGIDSRGGLRQRRQMILGYLGGVELENIWMLLDVLLSPLVCMDDKSGLNSETWKFVENAIESKSLIWENDTFQIDGIKLVSGNRAMRLAALESLGILIKQVKMKLASHVHTISFFFAGLLAQSGNERGKNSMCSETLANVVGSQDFRLVLKTLADWMSVFPDAGWAVSLAPVIPLISAALFRSSPNEVSASMRLAGVCFARPELRPVVRSEGFVSAVLSLDDLGGAGGAAVLAAVVALLRGGEGGDKESRKADYSSAWAERRKRWKFQREEVERIDEDDNDADMLVEEEKKQQEFLRIEAINLLEPHLQSLLTKVAVAIKKRGNRVKLAPIELEFLGELSGAVLRVVGENSGDNQLNTVVSQLVGLLSSALPECARKQGGAKGIPLLRAISALLPAISRIPSDLISTLSELLGTVQDLLARQVLADTIRLVGFNRVAEWVVRLNSLLRGVATLQPDCDSHVEVYAEIEEACKDCSLDVLDPNNFLLKHSLFVVSVAETDFGVRHSAERLLLSSAKNMEKAAEIIMPGLRRLLLSAEEVVQRSTLKMIAGVIRLQPVCDNIGEIDLLPFMSEVGVSLTDEGGDILEDLQHLQKHRRARAFARLASAAEDQKLGLVTMRNFVVPLAFHGLLQRGASKQNYDPNLGDNAIRALSVAVMFERDAARIELQDKSRSNLFRVFRLIVAEFLPRYPERERQLLRALAQISSAFVLGATADDKLYLCQPVRGIVSQLRSLVSSDIAKKKRRKEEEGDPHVHEKPATKGKPQISVRVDVVSALLSLLKVFPESEASAECERLALQAVQGLPAREVDIRNDARRALCQCAIALGPSKLQWVLKQIRNRLNRGGYQSPVSVFSAHAVVTAVLTDKQILPESLLPEILSILSVEDERWWAVQSRATVNEGISIEGAKEVLPHQVMEAKHPKGHILLSVVAENVENPHSVLTGLFQPIYSNGFDLEGDSKLTKFLYTASAAQSTRFARRIEDALRSVVQGYMRNPRGTDMDRFSTFCSTVLKEGSALIEKAGGKGMVKVVSGVGVRIADSESIKSSGRVIFAEPGQAVLSDSEDEEVVKPENYLNKNLAKNLTVQPGAAQGKALHQTDIWKKGNGKRKGDQGVRGRMLCLLGLRELQKLLKKGVADPKLLPQISANVSRCFCSGSDELFVASSKCLQRLLIINTDFQVQSCMDEKLSKQVLRTILSSLQHQSAANADGLSARIVLHRKSKALAHPVEIATTCTRLLVALLLARSKSGASKQLEEEFFNKDGSPSELADALVSHILTGLDRKALQGSVLMLLKRVIMRRKVKISSVYDCCEKAGELLITASSPQIAGLAGNVYARFMVDYEHSDGGLSKRLSFLMKHLGSPSNPEVRKNFANALHSFVVAVSSKVLQSNFAAMIVLPCVAQTATETDVGVRQMLGSLVEAILNKIDSDSRKSIIAVIAGWPSVSPKWQLHLAALNSVAKLVKVRDVLGSQKGLEIAGNIIKGQVDLLKEVPENTRANILASALKGVEDIVTVSPTISVPVSVVKYTLELASDLEICNPQLVAQSLALLPKIATKGQDWNKIVASLLKRLDVEATFTEENVMVAQGVLRAIVALIGLCGDSVESHEPVELIDESVVEEIMSEDDSDEQVSEDEESIHDGIMDESSSSEEDEVVAALIDRNELGLFVKDHISASPEDTVSAGVTNSRFLRWLLVRMSFLMRSLMRTPPKSVIRLAVIVKLSMALITGCQAESTNASELIRPVLSILVRLSTIRLFHRETAEDEDELANVSTLASLYTLPQNRQLHAIVKIAEEGLGQLESFCKANGWGTVYATELSLVRGAVQQKRSERRIDRKVMAVREPERFAGLKIKKNEAKRAKAKIKRVDFIQNKRRMTT